MREAKTSALTSEPNLRLQRRPFASVTLTFGFVPPMSSSTKVSGSAGAHSVPPGPLTKSSDSTAPGSFQTTGLAAFASSIAFALFAALSSFCTAYPGAATARASMIAINGVAKRARMNLSLLTTFSRLIGSSMTRTQAL